jgi:hypothetical protein
VHQSASTLLISFEVLYHLLTNQPRVQMPVVSSIVPMLSVEPQRVSKPSEPDLLYPSLARSSRFRALEEFRSLRQQKSRRDTLLRQDFEDFGTAFIRIQSINEAFELLSINELAAIISDVNRLPTLVQAMLY